ncbi:DUF1731 domain-containing protein, partial [Roseibium sp.]|uniref:DUF1731 domain-containing protein n=1 Tax=Roseibium sp. TaxID=1936156 RepID=UPI001B17C4C8
AEFTRALAKALHRPAFLRLPAWLLSTALGDMGRETMLAGQRVVPAKLVAAGFRFHHPELAPMLQAITGTKTGSARAKEQEVRSLA